MAKASARWKRVKFGDVVRQVKSKVDPDTAGVERYVAGEHMDTDDLRIRRWGEVGDGYLGPAFHMRFKPGQVLYGSRRTYLRKVAVADFEGICANTTFVLESADPSRLLPEFLPVVMQTEEFHEHSKRESKGSVNPYVNYSDLAWYEFALPPLEEQRRIAEATRASTLVRESLREAQAAATTLVDAFCTHVINSVASEAQVEVGKVAKFSSGKSISVTTLPQAPTDDASVPVYGGNGIAGYTSTPLTGVPAPTVVIGRVGQFCGVTSLTPGPAWITDNALYPVSIDERIEMAFLALVLRGRRLNRGKLGEYLPLITQKVVHATLIPVPSRVEQRRAVEGLREMEDSLERTRRRLREADVVHQRLLATLNDRKVAGHVIH